MPSVCENGGLFSLPLPSSPGQSLVKYVRFHYSVLGWVAALALGRGSAGIPCEVTGDDFSGKNRPLPGCA